MAKYILTITQNKVQNDGLSKPKKDINQILERRGYRLIYLDRLINRKEKLTKTFASVRRVLSKVNSQDELVIHYPTYMGTLFDRLLIHNANNMGIKTVAFVHDIDSLRFKMTFGRGLRYEISTLNKYSYVIVPNRTMLCFLKKQGLNAKCVSLKLFDYLTENSKKNIASYSHVVSFAGNLNKAEFVFKLVNTESVSYQVYGPLKDESLLSKEMYFGNFPSDILLKRINSGFGLVWDGPNKRIIDDGVSYGNYLRFNNPYKLSFYIAAGVPVIIWGNAAEANFVVKHNIGLVINSLSEIPNIVSEVSEKDYSELIDNIEIVRKKVLHGEFTLNAMDKIDKLS